MKFDATEPTAPFDMALLATIQRLKKIGVKPFVLLQVPHQRVDIPKALAMARIFDYDLSPYALSSSEWIGIRNDKNLIGRIKSAGVHVLDPRPYFMNPTKQRFIIEKDGVSLYRDRHHLSASGAKLTLVPCFRETFILQSPHDQFTWKDLDSKNEVEKNTFNSSKK